MYESGVPLRFNPCFSGSVSRSLYSGLFPTNGIKTVSILVLVDQSLGGYSTRCRLFCNRVSILVLVDQSLGALRVYAICARILVSILVLVDQSLGGHSHPFMVQLVGFQSLF